MTYTHSHLEDYITNLLRSINVQHPHQLNIDTVTSRLEFEVHYLPFDAMYLENYLFLDSRTSKQKQWQDFGHEFCHARLHEGDQALISAMQKDYQEFKADNFAQHFCIPSFMLDQMKFSEYDRNPIVRIQEAFSVEYSFAEKRLHQYIMNLQYS